VKRAHLNQERLGVRFTLWLVPLICFACFPIIVRAAGTLDFYFLDVELGNATLIVTPSGQTLLIDGGNQTPDNRDARRVLALAKQLGITQLDYLVVTHYHGDHYGAIPEISRHLHIVNWVDHGPNVEHDKDEEWQKHWIIKCDERLYAEYLEARQGSKHLVAKPGDKIWLDGMKVQIVSSGGKMITVPLPGAGQPNPACGVTALRSEDDTEDGQSVGMVILFGRFRYAFLGDLTWNKSRELFCPNNLLGRVDVYETTHHGMSIDRQFGDVRWGRSCCSEAEVSGLHPTVAILNTGEQPHRHDDPQAWQRVHGFLGLGSFWQLHYVAPWGRENNAPEPYIANLSAVNDEGHWIKVAAEQDGTFSVTNSRNGLTKKYPPSN
jgi:beta-lactamase superfamily II metal-dependent hydrolase